MEFTSSRTHASYERRTKVAKGVISMPNPKVGPSPNVLQLVHESGPTVSTATVFQSLLLLLVTMQHCRDAGLPSSRGSESYATPWARSSQFGLVAMLSKILRRDIKCIRTLGTWGPRVRGPFRGPLSSLRCTHNHDVGAMVSFVQDSAQGS